ncbi:hypothetical protein SCHPADRAFT_826682 [Schizopora paradoxa]|uniref:Polysaccharide lyase 14 domain-containing protein n=1 Tax=Schizopora paradoxa TaxID=27342 RepID=A0A0H2RRQ7_9AGAM|nr:hypothetical protein SCHPADRAFT_826682 [Schizopora paradoxa]
MYSFYPGRWTTISSLLFALTCISSSTVRASATPAASVAATYSLTTSTAFPFPTATLDVKDTNSFISSGWSLSKGRVQNGANLSEFVADPFPNSPVPVNGDSSTSSGPVFQVTYPAGSFNNDTGGAQFISLWNSTSPFQSIMVSYEIAFDTGFNFVKGGKLPGVRGGPSLTGCSGGKEADGTTCFSSRLMWRTEGEAEVYAYIPETNNLCDESGIICNSDFGVSVDRGAFTFPTGQWSRVTQLVQLNDPNSSNGFIALYFNDILAIQQGGLQIRTSSAVDANAFFFSTFFGGHDDSWATPVTTHTYFRNIELWGSSQQSTQTSSAPTSRSTEWGWIVLVSVFVFFCGIELV